MPRNRLPSAVAVATGAAAKNPQRYRGRANPKVPPLGKPSGFLDDTARKAWACFVKELPWLTEADRAVLEVASLVRGKIMDGIGGVNAVTELRLLVGTLGATPVARSKISQEPDEAEDDPAAEFLN